MEGQCSFVSLGLALRKKAAFMSRVPWTIVFVSCAALVSPTTAFRRLTLSVTVIIFLSCIALQAGSLLVVFSARPTLLEQRGAPAEATDARKSPKSNVEADRQVLVRGTALAGAQVRRTVLQTLLLSGFWFAAGQFIRVRAGWMSLLLGCLVMAIVAGVAWLEFSRPLPHPWFDLVLIASVFTGLGWFLTNRGEATVPQIFGAVVLADLASTVGFLARVAVGATIGHDPGAFTMVALAPSHSIFRSWLGRIDVFGVWWCVIAAAGFAIAWERRYWVICSVVCGSALSWMLVMGGG